MSTDLCRMRLMKMGLYSKTIHRGKGFLCSREPKTSGRTGDSGTRGKGVLRNTPKQMPAPG
jgi:hypothetical protein